MANSKRIPTPYPGVFYRETRRIDSPGTERVYYIVYKRGGKPIEEKVGRQFADSMTPAIANNIRSSKITGKAATRRDDRAAQKAEKEAADNKPTINYLWGKYIEAKHGMKGIKQDTNRFDHYLRTTFGEKTPGEILSLDLERLRRDMAHGKIGPTKQIKDGKTTKQVRTPKKPQTVKHVLVLLRRVINHGVEEKLCSPPNFSFKRVIPKVDNEVTEHLTDAQTASLLAALAQEKDQAAVAIVRLAILTGMRKKELLSLQWHEVDLDRALVRIVGPKGGKSQTIPISSSAVDVLRGVTRTKSSLVFPGKEGKQRYDLKRPLDRIRIAAGLPKGFRPLHGLRHHFASTLASSGQVDLYTLQKLLTHKDPATTQRYAHLRDKTLRNAADVAAKAVQAATATAGSAEEGAGNG